MNAVITLRGLHLTDPPARWEALGFTVVNRVCEIGEVRLKLGGAGRGITGWSLSGVDAGLTEIDGLPTEAAPVPDETAPRSHPNTATAIDHVVVTTPDFDRTSAALNDAGMPLRRIRDAGGFRMGFRRLGPAILELVESTAPDRDPDGPASFWGLVVIVADIDALRERLGDRLGSIRVAVQPGRRIATLSHDAGVSTNVAFMTPEP